MTYAQITPQARQTHAQAADVFNRIGRAFSGSFTTPEAKAQARIDLRKLEGLVKSLKRDLA